MSAQTIDQIANALGAVAVGDVGLCVSGLSEPAKATSDHLALAMSRSFAESLAQGTAHAAILWEGADWQALGLKAAIFAHRPRYALSGLTKIFDTPHDHVNGVHPTAIVDPSAVIGEDVSIGPFAIIGQDVRIGDGSILLGHCTIAARSVVGKAALLHMGVRIGRDVHIGNNLIAQANAVIGSDGFSFVTPTAGNIEEAKATGQVSAKDNPMGFTRIYSLGGVVIGDDVEIGANASIDQGTIAPTRIGGGTKLDNQVHVGHNVQVGQNCLLCGQVGIAGSTKVGDRVVLGGQVGVADHLTIGSDVLVAGKSGVSSNIPSGRVMMGNPAMKMDQNVAAYKALRRLPRFLDRVLNLEKRMGEK